MSNYNGKCGQGYAKTLREAKRSEAEARNALTPAHRRRAFLLGPVPEGGRTVRSVQAYENKFIAEHSATPRAVREHTERMTAS